MLRRTKTWNRQLLAGVLAVWMLLCAIPQPILATVGDAFSAAAADDGDAVSDEFANTPETSDIDLFVFAGQSNMMGASVLEPKADTFTDKSLEYKYVPKLRGEATGSFVPAQNPAGEFYYKDLAAAYGDKLNDLSYKSTLSNYSANTHFCPAMRNGEEGFSAQSEATTYPSASLAPYFVTEYAEYGHASVYAHMAKGAVKIVHYFTEEMATRYNTLITEYNSKNGKSYGTLSTNSLSGAGDAFDNKYNAMVEDYAAFAPDNTVKNKCFVWLQGEGDGGSSVEYKLKLQVLWEHLQGLGFTHFFVLRVGYWGNAGILNIIKAQEDFCAENDNCYIVTRAPSLIPYPTATTDNWWINEPSAEYNNCRDSYLVNSSNNHFNEKAMQLFAERSAANVHRVLHQGLEPVLEEENIQGMIDEEPDVNMPEDAAPYTSYIGTGVFHKGLSVSNKSGIWMECASGSAASTDLIPVKSADSVWLQYVFFLNEAHAVGGFYDKEGDLVAPLYYKDFGFSLGGGSGEAAFRTPKETNRISIAAIEAATGKEIAFVRFTAWRASAGGHASTEARIYHSYSAVATAPTCTEQGYTTHTCACGDSYVDDYTDAAGHSYEDGTCTVCGFSKKPYQRLTYFTVDVADENGKAYTDNAVLYLPANYTPDGDPVKLVIYCKQGASQITASSNPIESVGFYNYLISLGYAVLGVDGVPDQWRDDLGICERAVGNPFAVQGTEKAYDYVIENYNIAADGCFISGYSQGGHYAQNVIDLTDIPILAAAEQSPVCSMQYHQWDLNATVTVGGVKFTKGARLNVARIYGFPAFTTNTELLKLAYDASLVAEYDPWVRNSQNVYTGFVQKSNLWYLPAGTSVDDITMKKTVKCPVKIWCAEDDTSISADVMKVFVKAIQNAGGIAEISVVPKGGHGFFQNQAAVGTFTENGKTYNTLPIAVEIADWFSQYGGYTCDHTYQSGICTVCGATASPYLQQLPENILGCTNLYSSLVPVKGYYTATKYDTSNGNVLSVVIPVEPGDRIASSSFGSISENMGSVDGIRVTYLQGDKIVTSLSADDVYNAYANNGYIIVPNGVDAVCVPWWKPNDDNWLTLRQIDKDFAVHRPKTVSAQAPTCTESGYTAGEICEICNVVLCKREEIPSTGHIYSGDVCTVCGAINLETILSGKYVSILGDSISTFNGYSNDATVNTTIGGNGPRYDAGIADTKPGSYCLLESVDQTWWMHFANGSGMKLLVNNSWAGSQVFGGQTSDGRVIPAAYLDRCVNLHDNTLENNPGNAPINPDVIFVYLGINDYNFNRGKVGSGTVDYGSLVNNDGTYVTPTTFGEAYGIMLCKMREAYPDAQIFAMTLLPENLYSVDKNAWEQHNAYIRAAAKHYDIPVVDLAENCSITWENYSSYMIDKIHPTTAGMKLISNCIETELVAYYKENPPHAHSHIPTITPPTCTEQGYTTHTCACGDSYVDSYVPATGHKFSVYTTDGNATYGADGTKTALCDHGCGAKDTVADVGSMRFPEQVTSSIYAISGGILGNVPAGTTVSVLLSGLDWGKYCTVFDASGKAVDSSAKVATGMVVKLLRDSEVKQTLTIAVRGDTSGDGAVTLTDFVQIKAHLLQKQTLTGAAVKAADYSADGSVTVTDFMQVKALLLRTSA